MTCCLLALRTQCVDNDALELTRTKVRHFQSYGFDWFRPTREIRDQTQTDECIAQTTLPHQRNVLSKMISLYDDGDHARTYVIRRGPGFHDAMNVN